MPGKKHHLYIASALCNHHFEKFYNIVSLKSRATCLRGGVCATHLLFLMQS